MRLEIARAWYDLSQRYLIDASKPGGTAPQLAAVGGEAVDGVRLRGRQSWWIPVLRPDPSSDEVAPKAVIVGHASKLPGSTLRRRAQDPRKPMLGA